ncbi:acyl-CoA-binding protein [Flavobacterium sp. JP2137]|uniref:acyl-CoA-binding protein n=1 Tax=Flavobacterium sp. JP2137 TaxID=3414510 RepID=UPI003D2FE4BA
MTRLDTEFQMAYQKISEQAADLPPDTMLSIYAYYKQATEGEIHQRFPSLQNDLVNAFKFNAWSQISHLSKDEAKQAYIDLAHSIFAK